MKWSRLKQFGGKLQGTRHEGEFKILLYKIDEFYFEAWDNVKNNILRKFIPFDENELLIPYFGLNYN